LWSSDVLSIVFEVVGCSMFGASKVALGARQFFMEAIP
jgi:hypothetical protein